ASPTIVHKSPRLSPQKEVTAQRRKLKLNEEVEEFEESTPNSCTLLEDTEEEGEASKEKEEEDKRLEEIGAEDVQDMETHVPNLEAK
ncbi:hypothetical protein KI387_012509, partial [Taxus chinensis]